MDRKFFAYLLIGLSLFLLFNNYQQNKIRERDEQKKREQIAEVAKQKRLDAANALAEAAAKLAPGASTWREPDRQRHTLGSMDPTSNYKLLVTLDNEGASVERIELVSQTKPGKYEFRSLENKSGYLGYLALEENAGALVVNSVPHGSPAHLAKCTTDKSLIGLQVGDRIVGWDGLSGSPSYSKWDKYLASHPHGTKLPLNVERRPSVPPTEPASPEVTTAEQVASIGAPTDAIGLTFECVTSEKPLDVLRAQDDFFAEQVSGNFPIGSCAMTLSAVDLKSIEEGESTILGLEKTLKGRWDSKPMTLEVGMGVEFTMPLQGYLTVAGIPANLELVKQYKLMPLGATPGNTPDGQQYHLELTTIVRNLDPQKHSVAIRQEGLNGISLEGWWYPTKISPYFFSAAGARDIIVSDGFTSHNLTTTRVIVSNALSYPLNPELNLLGPADNPQKRSLNYVGLDTQTFTAAMLPGTDDPDALKNLNRSKAVVLNSAYTNADKLPSTKHQAINVGFWFETETKEIAPKGEWKHSYLIFAGPKDPNLLHAYQLDGAIEYGWQIFGFFAKLLRQILHFFFWITGNFGVSIIMLTVMVRALMFPVSRKMALNAQKMQSVQPHLAKLRESLKEDPRKMMTAQQLLMKKAGINQFAGCLPAMIQLPIVIGLYRCVSVDVGLRQQALIPGWDWCSNLAGPDMWLDWQSWMWDYFAGRGSGWFGPYFNILPIITITLFIIQQKVLMPKATDEQTRVAQQMMMIMTVMMGVLFFKVPAGLCIYFITSSSWSLVERFLIKRFTPKNTIVTLSDNVANEILNTLAKTNGAAPQRAATNSEDRPKTKQTKSPETLAELFPGWFGKKEVADESKPTNGSSGPGDKRKNKVVVTRTKRSKKR